MGRAKGTDRRKGEMSLSDMVRSVSEGLNRVSTRPSLWGYEPHAKQIQFHSSEKKGRLYIGGNRSGKTVGGVVEDLWYLMGKHPYKKTFEPPVRGRIIGVDFDNGIERILKPEVTKWIPPSALINGSWTDSFYAGIRTLYLENGSQVEFMSYAQELDTFAGTSRHFVHFDEEPPKAVYTENKMRLIDTGGHWWVTMTPVEGMTWAFDDLYIPGTSNDPYIDVIEVDMSENPYLNQAEIDSYLSGLSREERQARKEGRFVQLGGVIFKRFSDDNVIESIDPASIQQNRWNVSVDHGFNNPTAILWHAISPQGFVVTFHEHYMAELTVEEHAKIVKRINHELGREPDLYIGDPAMKQRNGETGHSVHVAYIQNGIPIVLANNDVRSGIDRMNQYLGKNYWLITDNCPNLLKEIKRYRWKTWESKKLQEKNNPYDEPHKKDDHAVDSARYFFTLMPDLKLPPPDVNHEREVARQRVHEYIQPKTPVNAMQRNIDPFVLASPPQTEWNHIDEYMGGLF